MADYEVVCWSHPEFEEVVAEITRDVGVFGIISDEDRTKPLVHLYPRPDGRPWQLELREVREMLEAGWSALVALDKGGAAPPDH